MSKTIENIYTLYNNPFLLTPIIVKFYESYKGKQSKDLLLAYLVLPIVLYEESSKVLSTKNKNRELRTFINYEKEKHQKNNKLFGLPDRVEEYKKITNLCIQYAIDRGNLKVEDDLSILFLKNDFLHDNTIIHFVKASENFAEMLKKEKLMHIYLKLGIKNL